MAWQGRGLMALPSVRVSLPWLRAALAEAAATHSMPSLDALRWLGGRGRVRTCAVPSWREWLLEPTGVAPLLGDWPAGPTVTAAQGLPLDAVTTWCLAQPVHLATGLDHLRLAALADAVPSADEARAITATLGTHFGDVMSVAGYAEGSWLLNFPRLLECATHPPETVVGHDVHDFMPAGRDGARVRSVMNEIQMLLHEHPVNERRVRARQLPINAWWLWGFGTGRSTLPATQPGAGTWSLRTDDRWLRALWSLAGKGHADAGAGLIDALAQDTLIAVSPPPAQRTEESLAAIDAGLLSWLAAQVRTGAIGRLELLAGDVSLRVDAFARFKFWRRPLDPARWVA
jgi:hypothetical protein